MAHAVAAAPTWEAFVAPLEDANERIGRAWGQASHLHAVLDSPELREAYNASLPKVTQYWTELGQNQGLFEKYQELAASPGFQSASKTRKRIVENALRDFRLGGAELPASTRRALPASPRTTSRRRARMARTAGSSPCMRRPTWR